MYDISLRVHTHKTTAGCTMRKHYDNEEHNPENLYIYCVQRRFFKMQMRFLSKVWGNSLLRRHRSLMKESSFIIAKLEELKQ